MTTSGLEYDEVECWISPAARYWLRVVSTSLAKIGLMRWGRKVTGALPSETEISKGIKEPDPNSVVEVRNTSGSSHLWHPIRLRSGKLEVMLSNAFQAGANRLDMRYQIGIEHNDIVEVCRHLF